MNHPKIALAALCAAAMSTAAPVIAADPPGTMPADHSTMAEMPGMKMHATGDADHDFASMMRRHQQMGITMAEEEIRNGKDSGMKDMARKIVEMQKKDLKQLDAWLASHKASPSGAVK